MMMSEETIMMRAAIYHSLGSLKIDNFSSTSAISLLPTMSRSLSRRSSVSRVPKRFKTTRLLSHPGLSRSTSFPITPHHSHLTIRSSSQLYLSIVSACMPPFWTTSVVFGHLNSLIQNPMLLRRAFGGPSRAFSTASSKVRP